MFGYLGCFPGISKIPQSPPGQVPIETVMAVRADGHQGTTMEHPSLGEAGPIPGTTDLSPTPYVFHPSKSGMARSGDLH